MTEPHNQEPGLLSRLGGDALRIVGQKVILRPVGEDDLNARYLGWLNDPEVNRYSLRSGHRYDEADMRDYIATANASPRDLILAVTLAKSGQHIGNVSLSNWDERHRTAEISNLIGERDHWGKGIVIDADSHLIQFAFTQLNIEKIIMRNLAPHRASTFKSRQLGAVLEGKLREHVVHNGERVDVLQFGLLRSDFYSKFPEFSRPAPADTP